jgi:hypothetical protein
MRILTRRLKRKRIEKVALGAGVSWPPRDDLTEDETSVHSPRMLVYELSQHIDSALDE